MFHKVEKHYNKMEMLVAQDEKRPPFLLPNLTHHVLRHTYCTRMAEASMDIDVLQSIMEPQRCSCNLDVYNHADKERIMSQLCKINMMEL